MADNQPASIVGTYGNPDVHTPNIDRLANEGLRFTRAYAVHGMCSPTRATLLTGLLPPQHGVQDWLDDEEMTNWPGDWNAIREYRTLPYTLKNRGYQTALIGKWHLGQPRPPEEWYLNLVRMHNDPKSMANVASQNTMVDDGVGRLLEALKDNGLEENTLVI